ncbi:MAG: hypothetical protein NVV68_16800 [Dokdonella sp.]|nr:hypothetical protein [Dokdonella sp.]
MQLERIVGDFLAGAERFLDVAEEADVGRRGRVRIEAFARIVAAAQWQALVVVEHRQARAGRQQQREVPAARRRRSAAAPDRAAAAAARRRARPARP